MKITNFLWLIVLCLFMASCSRKDDIPRIDNPLSDANNEFAFNFLQQINATEQGEDNYMISPVSASLALSMAYNGANGQTATEFNQRIIDGLTSGNGNTTFDIANSIWYRNTFTVKQDFLDDNQTYYRAEVQGLDFDDPNSVNIINNWVSDND